MGKGGWRSRTNFRTCRAYRQQQAGNVLWTGGRGWSRGRGWGRETLQPSALYSPSTPTLLPSCAPPLTPALELLNPMDQRPGPALLKGLRQQAVKAMQERDALAVELERLKRSTR